jgi:hypothetical protein
VKNFDLTVSRSSFKTASEKGTVPFFLADSKKLGQSPAVLKLHLINAIRVDDRFVQSLHFSNGLLSASDG